MSNRWARLVAVLAVTVVVVPVLTAGTVLAAFLFLPLPAVLPEARRGVEAQISRVYDIHGRQIGEFRQFDVTEPVRPEDIPQVLKDAVIAAEDRRFYDHGGVDVRGTLRALWNDIFDRGGVLQGGSTITQQYVKNAYVGAERSISRKVREAILASQLDRQLDKDEILFRYLDRIYLGEGAYGVGAAARTYFGKHVRDLTLSEAALLAGLIPAPSAYEPRGNPEAAENKRRIVLDSMLQEGYIDQVTHDLAALEGVWLVDVERPPPGQPVTAVRSRQPDETAYPYFFDYVRRYLDKYGPGFVYNSGLDIYTTLDPDLQRAAEEEVAATLSGTAPPLEMAMVAVEPGSGYVKALVGGRDFAASQVNLALGGSTGRQPGSGYKPFVLAEALEQGVSPDKTYSGRNGLCFPGNPPYCPENYGGANYGNLTLREATKRSVNTVYVQLVRDVGVDKTMELARRHGISRSVFDPSRHGLSVALGAPETTPLEMASAYGTWAARGERAEPTPVLRVLDRDQRVIEDNLTPRRSRVVKEVTADVMNSVMQGALQPGGTAAGRDIGRPAAGKTGTTNDNKDAWFTGYTPQLSTSVWIGYRDRPEPLNNIKGIRAVTGGTLPAQTWQRFMRRAHEGLPVADFDEPAPIRPVADAAKREARKGYDVGTRRRIQGSESGDYVEDLPPVEASPPTSTTTTTTTTPPLFG